MEYRRKCNVCGKIWCYTDRDLQESKSAKTAAGFSALAGIGGALSGNLLTMHVTNSAMNNTPKAVNYEKCPECNSSDTFLLEDKSIASEIATQITDIDYLQSKLVMGEKFAQNSKKTQSDLIYEMAKLIEGKFTEDEKPMLCVGVNFFGTKEPIDYKSPRCFVLTNKRRAWYCIGKFVRLTINNTVDCVEFSGIPRITIEDSGSRKISGSKNEYSKMTVTDSGNVIVFNGVNEAIRTIQKGLETAFDEWERGSMVSPLQETIVEPHQTSANTSFSAADEIKKV